MTTTSNCKAKLDVIAHTYYYKFTLTGRKTQVDQEKMGRPKPYEDGTSLDGLHTLAAADDDCNGVKCNAVNRNVLCAQPNYDCTYVSWSCLQCIAVCLTLVVVLILTCSFSLFC